MSRKISTQSDDSIHIFVQNTLNNKTAAESWVPAVDKGRSEVN